MMKTKKLITICLIIFMTVELLFPLALMFPIKNIVNDGGTVVFEPVTHLYRIECLHRINDDNSRLNGYITGNIIYIFGQEVYNDTRIADEK
ncbi:MAG: hypothetical protein IK990_12355 [Ruminiclostridium sp.]|nr:hypothetical protein [Ruminiclostridium sp.]